MIVCEQGHDNEEHNITLKGFGHDNAILLRFLTTQSMEVPYVGWYVVFLAFRHGPPMLVCQTFGFPPWSTYVGWFADFHVCLMYSCVLDSFSKNYQFLRLTQGDIFRMS